MAEGRRQAAERRGRKGESAAALVLFIRGYRILERRVRTPVGEIDIIALKDKTVVFVEVKSRTRRDDAIASVTPQAWQRIARAAEYWMARHPSFSDYGWRYDIVAVSATNPPHHIRDAWRPGMA